MSGTTGNAAGSCDLYDIGPDRFTWGSWILDANKPSKAALESALLSFGIGFETLKCRFADVDVHADNDRAISIYRRLGMVESYRTNQALFFVYSRVKFVADRETHQAVLEAA